MSTRDLGVCGHRVSTSHCGRGLGVDKSEGGTRRSVLAPGRFGRNGEVRGWLEAHGEASERRSHQWA